ncbi:MAG: ABC transporter permease [Oscillibacter sp.]|nr:ABC transporter permease [Oscillibacter sp.]
MRKYIAKRLLVLIPIILGVTFIIFSIMALTPSSPGRLILGIQASEEDVAKMDHELGYDRPFLVRFATYVADAVRGDFGKSYLTSRPVVEEISNRFPTTFRLAVLSVITSILIGVPLGILSAVKQYSSIDLISTVTAMFMASVPGFWLGLMMMLLFSLKLGWTPVSGSGTAAHYILPTLTLAIPSSASLLRLTRSTMLETIRQDYIRTARAKGVKEGQVIFRHALKNALLPLITSVGMHFGGLLGGTVLIESVFSFPGLGSRMLEAIRDKDIPMVTGCTVFLAVLFCLIMLLVDLLYAYVDPRVKAQYSK